MPVNSGRSSRRSIANRLAAASARSPSRRQVQHLGEAGRRLRPEGEQRFARPGLGCIEAQRQARRIMARQLAGRARRGGSASGVATGPSTRAQFLERDAARPQQRRCRAGRGRAPSIRPRPRTGRRRGSARPAAQLGGDMLGRGRADPARAVGRGRGERPPGRAQQRLRHRMRRHPHRHRVEPGAGEQRQCRSPRAAAAPGSAAPARIAPRFPAPARRTPRSPRPRRGRGHARSAG